VVLLNGGIHKFFISRGIDFSLRPINDSPCYVIPPLGDDPIFSTNYTHNIVDPKTRKGMEARIQFLLKNGKWVDPYDINPFGPHSMSDIDCVGYKNNEKNCIYRDREAEPNPQPIFMLEDWQYECPALVFVYLPEKKRTDLYDYVKLLSDVQFGINSQCMVQETCSSQGRRIRQYCSNVALKLNTKLFSKINMACAWDIDRGLSWFSEASTMVLGYAMSHGRKKLVNYRTFLLPCYV
jgi:hypothetical protein